MAKTFSLLNDHFFAFIGILIISIIVISFYMMVAPEKTIPYNFDPFPKEAPVNLPDPSRHTDTCWNKLTKCDSKGQCSACSLDEYKCVNVTKEQADAKYYHFNGINVPEGQYCLPKDSNPNPKCNMYTGRWLWVFDPEYCAKVSPGNTQCWKCDCLYPSVYSDPDNSCLTPQVCQNTSINSKSKKQPDNVLVGSEFGLAKFKGVQWDPESGTDTDILRYTPYDKDKNGNPFFNCRCNSQAGNQKYTSLPHDPHNCHLAPCYGYFGNQLKEMECEGDDCYCSCDATNEAKSPNGRWGGTCVSIAGSCGLFGWDSSGEGKCACKAPYWEIKCRSDIVNTEDKDLPTCQESENALGSECRNPCESWSCFNGSICASKGPLDAHCDCTTVTSQPSNKKLKWSGPHCAQMCAKEGTTLSDRFFGVKLHSGDSKCCCCSQKDHKASGFLHLTSKRKCSSGEPPDTPEADCANFTRNKNTCKHFE